MPINLGNGLVTGNIILRTGSGGGGGGGGASVNVPANSILYSSTGTDICGNADLQYDGDIVSTDYLNTNYLNGNFARIGDYYYDNTILLLFVDNLQNTIDNSFYKKTISVSNINYSYENIFKNSYDSAANFNGSTSYVTATDALFNIGSTGGTIEVMFKLSATSFGTIFYLDSTNAILNGFGLFANADSIGNPLAGGLSLYIVDGYINSPIWNISGLNTSTWYYFALSIQNNSSYKVYFGEGYPNNIATEQSILTPILASFTLPRIRIGAASESGNFFNGLITNFRMTSLQRYTETKIPIPITFFPKYNVGLDTYGARFNMRKTIDNELVLFIGANDTGSSDIVIGCNSATFNGGSSNSHNIVLGNDLLKNIATANINRNIIIGYNSLTSASGTYQLNNIIGSSNTANGSTCNILGYNSSTSTYTNCSILGNSTTVSANNQNQIGGTGTTTFTYGAVQNRSDLRDKDDVIDIPIGVNFINKLKPKFYRWNYREDYIKYDDSGNEIILPQDGTKKGKRFHAGLIAQDVKESMDELSVDFGLYQDHLVNGGKDVKSLGYAELIPVLIKAVQELSTKNVELENRIRILEDK